MESSDLNITLYFNSEPDASDLVRRRSTIRETLMEITRNLMTTTPNDLIDFIKFTKGDADYVLVIPGGHELSGSRCLLESLQEI